MIVWSKGYEMATQIPAPTVMVDIHQYLINEMQPFRDELFDIWTEAASVKIGIKEALLGGRVSRLTNNYQSLAERWVNIRRKAVSLDALISGSDSEGQQKLYELMSQPALMESIRKSEADVSSLMRDLADNLRGLRLESDFRRSGLLSVTAIVLAVGSLSATVLLNIL